MMGERFRVVPAAYVVLQRGPEVLLQLRQGTGYRDGHWAVAAAGHVEAGESVFEAACREAAEELGIVIDPRDLHPMTVMHRTQPGAGPDDERVDFFVAASRWSGEPRIVEADKAAGLRWSALGALPSPVVPHELLVLQQHWAGTLPPMLAFGF
jgi:8-oxo-dGTP diphosphatase